MHFSLHVPMGFQKKINVKKKKRKITISGWLSYMHVLCNICLIVVVTDLDRSAEKGLVSMVVLASADALCAPVTPIMDWTPPP